MGDTLAQYIREAAAIAAEIDDELKVMPAMVRRAIPASDRNSPHGPKRLALALDLLGIAASADLRHLRRRRYDTGPLDQALRLADAFRRRLFGPAEDLPAEDVRRLVAVHPGYAGRALDGLADALDVVGFSLPIPRTMYRGEMRARLDDEAVVRLHGLRKPTIPLAEDGAVRGGWRGPPADELLRRHFPEFARYTCGAQRDTVRELLRAGGAEDVIARIPTGWGKSLLYLLPVAEWKRRGEPHTAIVVAPIIALQNDQVARITNHYRYSGLVAREINSTVTAAEKTASYRALRRGELDLLFLSPERLSDPFFREILGEAAEHLRLLVIDEAHIVDAWGEDFRPEFFRLGRERQRLRERTSDLRTLYLSATLTSATEQTLVEVFQLDDTRAQFSEPAVRSELSVRLVNCKDKEHRIAALDELLCEVPRPAIVYFNTKDTLRGVRDDLRRRGLRRLCDYTGNTAADARRERLRDFHAGDIDVVLATNAFGLGVDKQDVRTIIHFDVPASLDAYYQEIGRAGRDGNVAHAFLLSTTGAVSTAARTMLARIKTDTAEERALAMLRAREDLPHDARGACLIPLHAQKKDIGEDSPLNQMWNRVVLNTLERVGVLTVDGIVPRVLAVRKGANTRRLEQSAIFAPVVKGGATRNIDLAALSKRLKLPFQEVATEAVRLVLARALEWETDDAQTDAWMYVKRSGATWSKQYASQLEAMREARQERARAELQALTRFLRPKRCRMRSLAELYEIQARDCGRCDVCAPALGWEPSEAAS